MSKIGFFTLAALVAAAATIMALACLVAAKDKNQSHSFVRTEWVDHGNTISTKVAEIDGHKYVLMAGFDYGGIVHAESCHCKKR